MYKDYYIIIMLLVIILVYCFSCNKDGFKNQYKDNKIEHFNIEKFDILDKNTEKYMTYDYLLTDGILFYLYNSRDLIIESKNPLIFETLDEAEKYRKNTSTPPLNITNLLIKKSNEDPTENYERRCSKKISPFNFRMNTCYAYSKTEEDIEKNKDLINDLSLGYYNLESCIIDSIGEENPDLKIESNNQKEIKFMDQFF